MRPFLTFPGAAIRVATVALVVALTPAAFAAPDEEAMRKTVDALMFPAPKPTYDVKLKGLELIPAASGGKVAMLRLPKPGAKTALIYFHGNAEDIGRMEKTLAEFRDKTGCEVFAIDYPGYGLTGGASSEQGCYDAADAALAHLNSKYGYKPDRVVLVGRSLGTGVAVDLAARHDLKGVVLIAPFKSALRVVLKEGPLPFDRFESLAKIDKVKCPLFIVHGEKDEVIPFSHGKALFDAAVSEKKDFLAVPAGRHNTGIPGDKASDYWKKIRAVTDAAKPAEVPVEKTQAR